MKLFQHQEKLLQLNPPKHLLAWQTGTAKSRTAIELAIKNNASFIVVCPKGLQENWRREIKKWIKSGYVDIDSILPDEENNIVIPQGQIPYKIISKERFRIDVKKLERYDAFIGDECHYLAALTSQLSKAVAWYIKNQKPQFIWLLTATPYLRNCWNVYVLAKILGYDWTYRSFRDEFFMEQYFYPRTVWVQKPGIENEIARLVNMLGSTVKLEDCIDYPEATYETEYFVLTAEQKRAMKEVKEPMPIVRFTKYHQIASGVLKGNEYVPSQRFDSDKFKRVLELIEENDKLIVSCCYLEEMAMIKEAVKNKNVYVISGDVDNKQEVLDKFNADSNALLIVNARCSEGWQASSAQLLVFYSYSFSLKDAIQMRGRVRRIDRPQKVTYLSLVVKDSIDEDVVECIERKESFDKAIYNYVYNH